jgi:hypothetical protein
MTRDERDQLSDGIDIAITRESALAGKKGFTIQQISRSVAAWRPDLIEKYCAYHRCTHEQALLDIGKTAEARISGIPPNPLAGLPDDMDSLSDEEKAAAIEKILPPDFETLSDDQKILWFSRMAQESEERSRLMQAQADALEMLVDYLAPILDSMPAGSTIGEAVREARRRRPEDFLDDTTIVTPVGLIKLPTNLRR